MSSKIVITISVVCTLLILACKKKDNTTNNSNANNAQTTGFYYAENGNVNYTKADSAFANRQFKTIIAQVNGATVVEFVVPDLTVGDYALNTRYAFTYVKDNSHWEATAGTLKITANDGQKISGTYEATSGSGVSGVNKVSGYFNDVPLK